MLVFQLFLRPEGRPCGEPAAGGVPHELHGLPGPHERRAGHAGPGGPAGTAHGEPPHPAASSSG